MASSKQDSVNEQFAHRAGVSATGHIDGLKAGDDKMDPVPHVDGVEPEIFETEAPETEKVDKEAAEAMSSSSVTVDDDGNVVDKVTKKAAAKKAPAKKAAKK